MTGQTGLIYMPDARIDPDGTWRTGYSINDPYSAVWISLTAMPRLEASLRYTAIDGVPGFLEPERAGLYGTDHFESFADPMDACRAAHLVTTDVWTSMGWEAENEVRLKDFADWQVDSDMMRVATRDALFMHCLPAHRGEEVTAEVIDGAQSVVWDEAENRLHVQKALMEFLVLGKIEV